LQSLHSINRFPELIILTLQATHLLLQPEVLLFKVYQKDIVLKNRAYGGNAPMKDTLGGRYDPQDEVMKGIPFITSADLQGDENNSTNNENNDEERATTSPEDHHLNN
jgi:hypothetical protein